MAFQLALPEPWASRGWKAKIRDRERVEPPHVSVIFKTNTWRLSLRTARFLDKEPPPGDVPAEVIDAVQSNLASLIEAWNQMYPANPVSSASPDKRRSARSKRRSTDD